MPRLKNNRRSPTQERSKHTVEVILEAAIQVFSRFGYAATTTQVAERAGVSVGSLYQYYPNKDALLVELYRRHTRQAHAQLHAVLSDESLLRKPLLSVCRQLSQAMISLHLHQPKLHRVFAEQVPHTGAFRRAKRHEEKELFDKASRLFAEHPQVNTESSVRAALFVGHLLESLSHWYVLDGPELGLDSEAFIDEQARLIAFYLAGSVAAVT